MAQRVEVTLVDDVDGSEAAETITFSLDGTAYEIDLSSKNSDAMRGAIAPWVAKARKAGRGKVAASRPPKARTDSAQLQVIREWAKQNGHPVSDRGRIPQATREAFEAAHRA